MDSFSSLCSPSQAFVLVETIYVMLVIFVLVKEIPFVKRVKMFAIAFVAIVGWTTIINYFCDPTDNNYIAWFLVIVPVFFSMIRRSK